MPLSVIGTFSYTNTTTALNQAPGNIIPSAGWNQIHGDILVGITQVYQQYLAGQTVGKNILFGNGGFEVWQRGAGASSSIVINNTATTGTYGPDRWYLSAAASVTCSMSAVAGIDTPNNSTLACRITRNSGTASTAITLGYPLDTESINAMKGQTLALSFWAQTGSAFSASQVNVYLACGTSTPVKLVVGYSGATFPFNGSFVPTSTATLFNINNVAIASNTAIPLTTTQAELLFQWTVTGAPSGANDYIIFDDVQLEVQGSIPLPYGDSAYVCGAYDHLPFSVMLRDCQQHFQKTFPYSVAPAQNTTNNSGALTGVGAGAAGIAKVATMWMFNPPMRASPSSIVTYHPSAASANWYNTGNSGGTVTTVAATVTVSSSAGALIYSASVSTSVGDMLLIHATADAGI